MEGETSVPDSYEVEPDFLCVWQLSPNVAVWEFPVCLVEGIPVGRVDNIHKRLEVFLFTPFNF